MTTPASQSVVHAGVWGEMPIALESTTSRALVKDDLLNVVEFVMDAGQELTDHASPRAVVIHIGAGEVRVSLDDVAHELTAGDVVYLAPGQRHAVLARTAARFTLVMVDVARA
jgi:quercetin dioxygenase-like cupin family protein